MGIHQEIISSHLGDYASLAGLLLSVGGFWITINTVIKSKKAVTQAAEAVERAITMISKFDAVSEIQYVVTSMDTIKKMHRDRAWPLLIEKYSEMRARLIAIRKRCPGLTSIHHEQLDRTIQYLLVVENQVEAIIEAPSTQVNIVRVNKTISEHMDILVNVLSDIRITIGR